MNSSHFQSLIDYNYWAHRQVWTFVEKLSEDQYCRPCDYSVGSIHDQLVHTYGAEKLWLERCQEIETLPFAQSDEFPDRASLRVAWDSLERQWRAFVSELDDARLDQAITYVSINGQRQRNTLLWQALMQTINHATDHRAQTLSLIHQVGGETGAQDFIFYSWDH